MSISSVSANNLAAVASAIVANTAINTQTQASGVSSNAATLPASSQTKVTLTSTTSTTSSSNDQTSLTYDQMLTTAQSEAASAAKASYTSENSDVLLTIGQDHMAAAIQSFASDWSTAQQTIGAQRPDLLNQKWDITTDKGTIQVVSNTLSAGDKAWLTGVLNQNKNLVADTQAINTTLVSTFGGTAAEAAEDPTGMTLSSLTQSSVDGTVHFLGLLQGLDNVSSIAFTGQSLIQAEVAGSSTANLPVAGKVAGSPGGAPVNADGDLFDGAALNVAYIQYLYPALAASSVQDGTADPLAGLNVPSSDAASVSGLSTQYSGMMFATSGSLMHTVNGRTMEWANQEQATLESALGANYRSYG